MSCDCLISTESTAYSACTAEGSVAAVACAYVGGGIYVPRDRGESIFKGFMGLSLQGAQTLYQEA